MSYIVIASCLFASHVLVAVAFYILGYSNGINFAVSQFKREAVDFVAKVNRPLP